jgi:hypothetical protein
MRTTAGRWDGSKVGQVNACAGCGSLLQHYRLRRVNTRGRSSTHKTILRTVIAFHLKKLLKHQPVRVLRLAIALPQPPVEQQGLPPT